MELSYIDRKHVFEEIRSSLDRKKDKMIDEVCDMLVTTKLSEAQFEKQIHKILMIIDNYKKCISSWEDILGLNMTNPVPDIFSLNDINDIFKKGFKK